MSNYYPSTNERNLIDASVSNAETKKAIEKFKLEQKVLINEKIQLAVKMDVLRQCMYL
jgi:hypothetical protein